MKNEREMAVVVSLREGPAPKDNPLKGFLPFAKYYEDGAYRPHFPHSMEWAYIRLSDVMTGYDRFTFDDGLEPILNAIQSRHHQAALRIHVDYPGQASGVPPFLLDAGVQMKPYTVFGGGLCPDYSDPRLLSALNQFVRAFGDRYDGDPRIGFITAGLVGFWGEWHTYPYNGHDDPEDWMPSLAEQERLLRAYVDAFAKTKVLVRYPTAGSPSLPMGYHDDSFAYSTIGTRSYDFMRLLEEAGELDKWQTEPIGGELRPELQNGIWTDLTPDEAQDYDASVQATHASWLINQGVFRTEFPAQGPDYERALAGHVRLGYELHVAEVRWWPSRTGLAIEVDVSNRGVAPFYYDWPIELALWDRRTGQIFFREETDWHLTTVLPGPNATVWHHELTWAVGDRDAFQILMRVANPMPGGRPLGFANQEQDRDVLGWLSLAERVNRG